MKNTDPKQTQGIKNLLDKSSNILILTHKSPDGDALGSSLGLMHYLRLTNKKTRLIVPDPYPDFLKWLPGNSDILIFRNSEEECSREMRSADLIFCIDFNEPGRLGKMGNIIGNLNKPLVLIDHHPGGEKIFANIISDVSASSSSELVFKLIKSFGEVQKMNIDIATCLYTGIMTDTGGFSYNSSGPDTFEIISVLLSMGINREKIHDEVYNNFTASRWRLLGFSLNKKLKIIEKYKTAYIYLSIAELKEYKHKIGDTEGFVNFPLSIKGIIISAIFIEHKKYIKASFRSKANVPVNNFAKKYFEGGGHKNAAGGQIFKPLKESIEYFENSIAEFAEEFGL